MNFELHDAKKDPPVGGEGITYGFHFDGANFEGRIAFYTPINGGEWAAIGNKIIDEKSGEIYYQMDDVTNWVDYWAPAPKEMYADEEADTWNE